MAIKNNCPNCNKGFTAPEAYLGKKVDCPRCGERVLLRSPDEVRQESAARQEEEREIEEGQAKLALLEKLESRRHHARRPYYETYGTGTGPVRHFNPGAPSRFLRLRAISEVLTFFAYFEVLLVLLGIGLTVYLKFSGQMTSIPLLIVCLIGWVILGTGLYLGMKFLSEAAFLLSELGDGQHDATRLLLDIRENTDGGRLEDH